MNKIFFIFTLFLLAAFPQSSRLQWFPDELLTAPYKANFLEPRMGAQFSLGENDLRLDIGSSRDILRMDLDETTQLSFGADFFTFTKLRGEDDFHFPVDAVDYLFGINTGLLRKCGEYEMGARLRFAHISAHLADGHYDNQLNGWRDNHAPQVYSREFLELLPYFAQGNFRIYAGGTYIIHIVPQDIKRFSAQGGLEWTGKGIISPLITPFAVYDLRTVTIDRTRLCNSVYAGLKFGHPDGAGFTIGLKYYSGKNIHGEYYNFDDQYTAFAFGVEL